MLNKPYLTGHFTPVPDEITAVDLSISGKLPPELSGLYVRNGHNPKPGITPSHWFRGSGMLHGVRLADGRAQWYRNRWVKTPALDGAPLVRQDGSIDLTASVAGTHIIEHGGRLLALQEANLPFAVTPELETLGPFDFHGKLTTAMTAHPKQDPETGLLHFFSYSPFEPHLTYFEASPDGHIVRSEPVPGAGPGLMHDFAITAGKAVFLDPPVVFDPAETSGIPYRWHDDRPARIGVLDRLGDSGVTWIEVDQKTVLHVVNACDLPDGKVLLEGTAYDQAAWETSWKWWIGAPGHPNAPTSGAVVTRWLLDPVAGTALEEPIDDLATDFPTVDDRLTGRRSSISYHVAFPGAGLDEFALVKLNTATGERRLFHPGRGRYAGEAVFVPALGGTAEDDGYLLTIVSDLVADASRLLVLNAQDLSTTASIHLPRRVPGGIHGSWIPSPPMAAGSNPAGAPDEAFVQPG
ncbi:carotenoid oxygenase family protein [Catenulispora sp. NF23]|uniref:carotenoid oxygenase family protein n=1 Tax=Catenulispora pinistramenti TaxID=2705254 RepID=UPI001BA6D069|nr:carotenoid oxygenase family protein [Catenulispora pinistramenti]MBS2531217.1 carotenoid oxygenase family protein [Catenulispora pinistramenti]